MAAKKIKDSDREVAVPKGKEWKEALAVWDQRVDFKAGADAGARFVDLLKQSPGDPDAAAWVARAHFYLGDYAHTKKQAGNYLQTAMDLVRPLAKKQPDHVPLQFWTACCIGKYVERVSLIRAPFYAPDIRSCLANVVERELHYYFYGPARFLGMSIPRAPKITLQMMKLVNKEFTGPYIISELETALEEGPMFVLTIQALAETCWHLKHRDKLPACREWLKRAEGKLDETPILAPENHLDLPRAQDSLAGMR